MASEWTENTAFYIDKNNLAYTQDEEILIRNILVKYISEEKTEDDLKKFFESFGEVSAVTFNEIGPENTRSANVLFTEPLAAAKALQHKTPPPWLVDVCDSWLQPLLKDSDLEECKTQNTVLTDLNDDIILEIINYLDIKDQLALVCAHARFLPAFETFALSKFRELADYDLINLTNWQKQQLFAFAGEYIQKFHLNFFPSAEKRKISFFCHYFLMNCQNLNTIIVSSLLDSSGSVKFIGLMAKMHNLKKLVLYDCSIGDECSAAISRSVQLKELELYSCYFPKGFSITAPQLKKFSLESCENLNEGQLQKTISQMTYLSTLHLCGSCALLPDIVNQLPHTCKHIETLVLSCLFASYPISLNLPKLKNLCFINPIKLEGLHIQQCQAEQIERLILDGGIFHFTEQLMPKLKNLKFLKYTDAKDDCLRELHTLQNLQMIKLDRCDEITNEALFQLVKRCQNLTHVSIQNTEINNDFADALLPWIKENKRPNGQLTFFAYGSEIRKYAGLFFYGYHEVSYICIGKTKSEKESKVVW